MPVECHPNCMNRRGRGTLMKNCNKQGDHGPDPDPDPYPDPGACRDPDNAKIHTGEVDVGAPIREVKAVSEADFGYLQRCGNLVEARDYGCNRTPRPAITTLVSSLLIPHHHHRRAQSVCPLCPFGCPATITRPPLPPAATARFRLPARSSRSRPILSARRRHSTACPFHLPPYPTPCPFCPTPPTPAAALHHVPCDIKRAKLNPSRSLPSSASNVHSPSHVLSSTEDCNIFAFSSLWSCPSTMVTHSLTRRHVDRHEGHFCLILVCLVALHRPLFLALWIWKDIGNRRREETFFSDGGEIAHTQRLLPLISAYSFFRKEREDDGKWLS
ncbi:hypothetical protein B0H16DRAFT_1804642 [Mycena metata]|uniref:Uncharacterized protein n=1 Tax=Mycena metata TaxID=1033252 RepID=A0AAD7JIX1_9AGAR|nr:hypothetical protein B0H16DRAFT_1804642 [Mycena metata]